MAAGWPPKGKWMDRFQCEVRHILKLRAQSRQWMEAYLALVEARRGKAARYALQEAAKQQWQMGNRGAWGVWYETDNLETGQAVAA